MLLDLITNMKSTQKKSHLCDTCGKSFTQLRNLTTHNRTHGIVSFVTQERTYECEFCDKSFAQSWDFTRHRRTHTGEKPYKCEFCDRCFTRSGNLTNHRRTHTGEKPYKCEICDRCFTRLNDLTNHNRTHTGEKPYKCEFCDKSFAQSSNLTRHNRTHTGDRSYKSGTLVNHKKTHRMSHTHNIVHVAQLSSSTYYDNIVPPNTPNVPSDIISQVQVGIVVTTSKRKLQHTDNSPNKRIKR